jgi:rifampicin phosphotransferase
LWEYLERVNAAGTRYFLPNIAISIGHGVLHRAVRALVSSSANGDAAEALCAALVACDTTTTRVNEELRTLARRAGDEGVADRLAHTASENLWVRESSDDTPFWTGLRSFIERHGHRETDFDAYHPTWADAPWVVLDHVAALRDAPDPAVTMTDTTIRQRELEASLLEDLPEPLRPIAAQVLVLARTYTALDDLEHYHTTRLSRPLRRGVCEIGRRLRGLGIVKEERDAFFARASSLASAIAGEREMETLGEEIRRAKDSYLRARNVSPRWSVGSESREEKSNGDQLAGIPGSPGEAEGLVHIVRGAEDFAAFPRGAILVARTTNPAWTPLFYSAAAVVTESGGPLSHGAVTAREMRIPAVMSVRGVLEVLRNGDRVRVNGASGSVMLLPAA